MKKTTATILLALGVLSVPVWSQNQPKPNIVLIIGDDQAWTDYGFMGHPDIQTPHLDKLAQRSLLFKRGYVAAPLCRPSLASMLTGQFPTVHGVVANDVDGNKDRERLDIPVREKVLGLPNLVRMLTSNGYLAHQSGKWWEGGHADGGFTHGMMPRPARHGSAESLAIGRTGMGPVAEFIDHAVGEGKPFFVWYAPFLPHTPHNPPARLLEKYQAPGRADDVAKYYAMCEWFDETCGDLLKHIDDKGLAGDTIVIFICDNGWVAASSNKDDPAQKNWKQYALRSKGSPFDNGVRTPIMISWPERITPADAPQFAHAIDIFPTIAAVTGLDAPPGLPGINLLDEPARSARTRVFGETHAIHNMTPGDPDETLQYLWCVEDEWKLIVRYHGSDTTEMRNVHEWDVAPFRLHRIRDDPQETRNLATEHREVVDRMLLEIRTWHSALPR